MEKVSIIIAAYNVESYIKKCLDSLLSQSLKDIQIIVVNDGATDKTEEICQTYTDPRVFYVKKENGGLSDARNYGLQYVTGEYTAFLDGDDFVEPTMYEKLYNCAISNNSDLVECSYYMDYPNKQIIKNVKHLSDNFKLIQFNPYNAWNKLIKSSILKESNLLFYKGLWYEDFNFNLKLASYIKSVSYVDEPLYHYIQRDASIMHTCNIKALDIYKVIEDIISFYKKDSNNELNNELNYFFVKELLISTGKRLYIYDKQNDTAYLNDNYKYVCNSFSNWKKNIFLRKNNLPNLIIRGINGFTYKLIIKTLLKKSNGEVKKCKSI